MHKPLWRTVWYCFKHTHPDLAILLLGIYPRKKKAYVHTMPFVHGCPLPFYLE